MYCNNCIYILQWFADTISKKVPILHGSTATCKTAEEAYAMQTVLWVLSMASQDNRKLTQIFYKAIAMLLQTLQKQICRSFSRFFIEATKNAWCFSVSKNLRLS